MAAADYRLMTEATGQRIAAALESLVNLGDPVTIAHGGTGASTAAAALSALGGVAVTDIVDNLTSTATDKPLSAAQGKVLNDKLTPNNIIAKINPTIGTLQSGSGVFDIGSIIVVNIVLSGCTLTASSNWTNIIDLTDFPSVNGTLAATWRDCKYFGINIFGTKIQAMTSESFTNTYVHIFGVLVKV